MTKIAPTAQVDKTAQLDRDVIIGPGCVVGPQAVIGAGCVLKANVMVMSYVKMGRNNRVFANCVLGEEPQMVGCAEPQTKLIIGDDNTFRENVTINRGSPKGDGKTVIGNNNYFMINSHVGHDCEIEDNCVIGNNSAISGHCKLEKNIWFSAYTAVQQFTTIGRFSFTAGFSGAYHDLAPFVRASGYPCTVRGLNVVGLKRADFSETGIAALQKAYRRLFRRRNGEPLAHAVQDLAAQNGLDENVKYLLGFLQRSSQHRMGRYRELFRH